MGNIFDRREKILKNDDNIDSELVNINRENIEKKDVIALIIAAFKIILPLIIFIVLIFFLVILFITEVWFK